MLRERRITSSVERKGKKSKGSIRICPSVFHLAACSYWIYYLGLQIENVYLLFHSLRLEKQGNLIVTPHHYSLILYPFTNRPQSTTKSSIFLQCVLVILEYHLFSELSACQNHSQSFIKNRNGNSLQSYRIRILESGSLHHKF